MQNLNCEYFCNYWFRDCTGLIEISYMDHFRERAYPQWFKLANIPYARMLNEKSRNVYYGLATRKGRRGTEEHVLELPGLWGDTDPKDFLGGQEHKEFEELAAKGAGKGLWDGNPQRLTDEEFRRMIELSEKARALMLKQLSQCPLPPTILISSGKGFQPLWKCTKPLVLGKDVTKEQAKNILRRLSKSINGDHTINLNRVFRTPGTLNLKLLGHPLPCTLLELNENRVYKLADFESLPEIETSSRFEEESGNRGKHGEIDLTKLKISSKIRELIYLGNYEKWGYKSRSESDMAVCVSLIHANLDFDTIKSIFANHAYRIGEKYRGKGKFNDAYLWRTYNNALDYIKTNRQKGNGSDENAEGKSYDYKEDEPFEPVPVQKYDVLPFPAEVFPRPIQKILNEFSKAVHCPVDFLGVPLLAASGVAIGTSRTIEIKPGWVEGARVNTAVVAIPGAKKSPALNLILRPIYGIQSKMRAEYAKEKEQYEDELSRYEIELKTWRTSKKNDPKPEEPEEPVMEQIFTTDSTLEALAELMEQNPRGILFARDELTG